MGKVVPVVACRNEAKLLFFHFSPHATQCLQVSMVEVYNECVYDLLVPPSEGHEKLQIQKKGKDVVVPVSELASAPCIPCIY